MATRTDFTQTGSPLSVTTPFGADVLLPDCLVDDFRLV